eukprot:scaffold804_cov211-Alexandrium_tamarense.AAC.3
MASELGGGSGDFCTVLYRVIVLGSAKVVGCHRYFQTDESSQFMLRLRISTRNGTASFPS